MTLDLRLFVQDPGASSSSISLGYFGAFPAHGAVHHSERSKDEKCPKRTRENLRHFVNMFVEVFCFICKYMCQEL
jgi:hypothetical protein